MEIEQIIKYERKVWANTYMDELRRDECLCLNCEVMDSCYVAPKIFDICKEDGMAMAITRCGAIDENGGLLYKMKE